MPEVHRDYYLVEDDEKRGFRLCHPSPEFSLHEARDIILAELSLSLFLNSSKKQFTDLFDGHARTVPYANSDMSKTLRALNEHYRRHYNEPPFLTEDGYHAACGVGSNEFAQFRAALQAMADYAIGMSAAIDRRIRKEGDPDNKLWKEMLEWISVCCKETAFFGFLKSLSGLEFDKLEWLVAMFSIDFRTGKKSAGHARDGFLPPLARIDSSIVYNPDLLKMFLTARNILFAVRHQDQKLFNEMVSKHLEPSLVQQAADFLRATPGLEITLGHVWQKGDIDILVYSPSENAALHIQAKAAIPPQGARMVQTIEGRVLEGLDQRKHTVIGRLAWLFMLEGSYLENQHGTDPKTIQRCQTLAATHSRTTTFGSEHCGLLPRTQTYLKPILCLAT